MSWDNFRKLNYTVTRPLSTIYMYKDNQNLSYKSPEVQEILKSKVPVKSGDKVVILTSNTV